MIEKLEIWDLKQRMKAINQAVQNEIKLVYDKFYEIDDILHQLSIKVDDLTKQEETKNEI